MKIHPTGWLIIVGAVGIGYLLFKDGKINVPWATERISDQVGPWPGAGPGVAGHPPEMVNQ